MSESDALARLCSFLKPRTTGKAKRFEYYDNWKNEIFTCPYCGWTGKIDQMEHGENRDQLDASCPQCWTVLAIVSYPSYRSTKDAAEAGNPEAVRELNEWETILAGWRIRRARWEQEKLVTADQLPDVDGDGLNFTLDIRFMSRESNEQYFELKVGERVIWR